MPAFPEIITPRLRLRKVRVADVPDIIRHVNNEKITDNVNHIPNPYVEEDAVYWLNLAYQGFKEKKRYTFAITQKEPDAFIGAIGLNLDPDHNRAEMGYWVAEDYWNQGIASEAAAGILRFGLEELRLNKIYATHFLDNPASARVMIRNGMVKEGELADHYLKDGAYRTVAQYRLTRREYLARRGTS